MTQKKRQATFPFEMIVMRIRLDSTPGEKCIFDQAPATHILDHFVNDIPVFKQSGMIDIDAIWADTIRRQLKGDYSIAYYQPVCEQCCVHFATIQLGKRRPIQTLLPLLSVAKKQQGMNLSLALMCTVKSLYDEGDMWAQNSDGATIEEIVKFVTSHKR